MSVQRLKVLIGFRKSAPHRPYTIVLAVSLLLCYQSRALACDPVDTVIDSFLTATSERSFVRVPSTAPPRRVEVQRTVYRYWEKQVKKFTKPVVLNDGKVICPATGEESSPVFKLIATHRIPSVAKLKLVSNESRFVTASAVAGGSIALTGWQIADRTFKQVWQPRDTGYPGTVFALSETRGTSGLLFALAYRNADGNLALSSWAQVGDSFQRRGRLTTTLPIRDTKIVLLAGQNGLLVTGAVGTSGRKLHIDTWTVDNVGVLTHLASGTYDLPTGSIQDISMALEGGLPGTLTSAISRPQLDSQLWEINTTGAVRLVAHRVNDAVATKVELAPRGWGSTALIVQPPAWTPVPLLRVPGASGADPDGTIDPNISTQRWLFFTNWWEGLAGDVSYYIDRNHVLSGSVDSSTIRIFRGTGNTSHPNLISAPHTDNGWLNRRDEQFQAGLLTRDREMYLLSASSAGPADSRTYSHTRTRLLSNDKSMRRIDFLEIANIVNYSPPPSYNYPTDWNWPVAGGSSSGGTSNSGSNTDDTLDYGVFSCTGTITTTDPPYSCAASLGTDTTCTKRRSDGAMWCPASYSGCTCKCSLGTCPQSRQ